MLGGVDIAQRRSEYETAGIDPDELDPDPVRQWRRWYDDAVAGGAYEPNAMTVATVDADGHPDSRYVLVRGADARGFVFFTDGRSTKAVHLDAHPSAALVWGWLELHRQVRVRGRARRLDDVDVDAYFASRPRGSQLAAWASHQSTVVASRAALDDRMVAVEHRFAGQLVPRPPAWTGYVVKPEEVEFWQGRANRFHDRVRYRHDADGVWIRERLSP